MEAITIAEDLKGVLQNRDEVMMRGDYGMELFAKRTASGELALSMKAPQNWELILLIGTDGTVKLQRVLFDCVAETFADLLRDEAQKAAQTPQACETMPTTDEPQESAQCVARAPKCVFYKSVRRCFAIAAAAGLDTKQDTEFRAACSRVLGRNIESREAMTGGDWLLVGNAIKAQRLAW
jgi:hypothetical protein